MLKYTLWSLGGVRNGFRLRIYGFTDLPPSLPLLAGTPETRISESSRCRLVPHTGTGTPVYHRYRCQYHQ